MQKENGVATAEIISNDPNPSALLQLAVQQNLDIDKLEKLMQLQERWQANISRKDFLNAISKFQFECPALEKTKKVAFNTTKYSYAPLGEIAATIKKPMSENGLSHRWEIEELAEKIICTCIISHINGHSEKTTMSALKDASGGKNEIQQRGSSITYLQRYTLIAALGISTADEDIDGRKDEPKTEDVLKPPVFPKEKTPPVPQSGDGKKTEKITPAAQGQKPWLNPNTKEWNNAFTKIHTGQIDMNDVLANYRISKANHTNLLDPHYKYEPTSYEQTQLNKHGNILSKT